MKMELKLVDGTRIAYNMQFFTRIAYNKRNLK